MEKSIIEFLEKVGFKIAPYVGPTYSYVCKFGNIEVRIFRAGEVLVFDNKTKTELLRTTINIFHRIMADVLKSVCFSEEELKQEV